MPTPPTSIATIAQLLEAKKSFLAQVLPKHLTPERIIKVALFARSRNPMLLQCTPESLLKAVLECAELGLEPSGATGGAHLVPFRNNKTGKIEATLIPDYRGLVDLARRSGQIVSIEAHSIHEKDKYRLELGLNPVLQHTPNLREDPGPMVAVYAIAKLRDGATQYDVMTKAQVDKIRSRSRAKDSGPWVTDYVAMAKKTVLKQLCKVLPRSRELALALQMDDETDAPIIDMELPADVVAKPKTSKVAAMKEHLKSKIVDVQPGETEEQAETRQNGDPGPLNEYDQTTGEVLDEPGADIRP